MEFIIKIYIILFILLFNSSLYSVQFYESYLDVIEEKINLENKDWQMQLLFSRVESIYLVFYDKKRKEMFVQFQNDVYDHKNQEIKKNFISGQPYKIFCEFKGVFRGVDFIPANSLQKEDFFNKDQIYICFLKKFTPILIDEIYF